MFVGNIQIKRPRDWAAPKTPQAIWTSSRSDPRWFWCLFWRQRQSCAWPGGGVVLPPSLRVASLCGKAVLLGKRTWSRRVLRLLPHVQLGHMWSSSCQSGLFVTSFDQSGKSRRGTRTLGWNGHHEQVNDANPNPSKKYLCAVAISLLLRLSAGSCLRWSERRSAVSANVWSTAADVTS